LNSSIRAACVAAVVAATLAACSSRAPEREVVRPVRASVVRYGAARDAHRYFASVQARQEAEQAFRVPGKVVERRVDVGQRVRQGDVLAVLDAVDYDLAEQAALQQYEAARARARQAESDWSRLQALKADGSVSASDEEHAQSTLATARAAAEAESRRLALARNQARYTVLRASGSGIVASVRVEVGQVVAAGQPVFAISNEGEPEIVVDVPEDHVEAFKASRYRATLTSAPDQSFEVTLRELSAQAAAQTRTYRARLKPATPQRLPLGASATLVAERIGDADVAALPSAAITQQGGRPAVWVVKRNGTDPQGTVELAPVTLHGYSTGSVLVSGPPAGALVVTAGVQKMSPGLRVAVPADVQLAALQ
jgi:RND family efflux transporter MFP subunit